MQKPIAVLYRMVLPKHACPHGIKAKALLQRRGYAVDDRLLQTREAVDAFKAEQGVQTTPQAFIDGVRIGGHDDLRRHFGLHVHDPKAVTYRPVVAVFATTALLALAISFAVYSDPLTLQAGVWFLAFSMAMLAMLKLQNI
jgi:glutaredoxin